MKKNLKQNFIKQRLSQSRKIPISVALFHPDVKFIREVSKKSGQTITAVCCVLIALTGMKKEDPKR